MADAVLQALDSEMAKYDPTSESFVIARNKRTAYLKYLNGEINQATVITLIDKGGKTDSIKTWDYSKPATVMKERPAPEKFAIPEAIAAEEAQKK